MDKNNEKSVLSTLPANYKLGYTLDLQNNKKQAIIVNLAAILTGVALVVPMIFLVPINGLFTLKSTEGFDIFMYALRFVVFVLGSILYIIFHELTHGIFMKLFGAKKVKFGFTFIYAYAGTKEEYFKKWPYIVIALAPVSIFFVIFAIACPFLVGTPWFWVVYFLQVQNIAGAMGDIIVSLVFLGKPKNAYIKDEGTSMQMFVPKD
ncbi:MAG: DUF3267 domain-containing protein [Clostridia bacterium]|nr:DUF3267 domain-containing protein [Clostridia bacterium]